MLRPCTAALAATLLASLVHAAAEPGLTRAHPATSPTAPMPAQRWMTAKYGLFVHHVFGGDLQNMTPLGPQGGYPADIDAFAAHFDAERFASQVHDMGFECVIFTAWHFNMNALYPSERMDVWRGPGHATTRRDLLGDIIDALRARGISAMLYSHVFVGHEFRPPGLANTYSYDNKDGEVTQEMRRTGYHPAASTPYGGQPPPPETRLWNDFINDIYDEMLPRYAGRVDALWFDGSWVWMIDRERLFGTVRRHLPHAAIVANGTAEHGYPFAAKEVGSPEGKDYGFSSEAEGVLDEDARTWPGYRRQVAIIAGSNWWATPNGSPRFPAIDIARYTILQAGTNEEGGGVAWSFGTYADGSFETGLYDRMRDAWQLMEPFAEGIRGTIPSRSFPTPEHATINTLEHGFVATQTPDGRRTYIHVLRPPEGRELVLPPARDGRVFRTARLLGSPGRAEIALVNGRQRIRIDRDWDSLNTALVLEE